MSNICVYCQEDIPLGDPAIRLQEGTVEIGVRKGGAVFSPEDESYILHPPPYPCLSLYLYPREEEDLRAVIREEVERDISHAFNVAADLSEARDEPEELPTPRPRRRSRGRGR